MLADPDKFIACPGVYDGFTARIALQEGVDCLYMVRRHDRPYITPRGAITEDSQLHADRRRYYDEQIGQR